MNIYDDVRKELTMLLHKWENNLVDEQYVWREANRMYDTLLENNPTPLEDNPDSIIYELLSQLSILDYQLICKKDIPVMRTFLGASPQNMYDAWSKWQYYWENLDLKERKSQLKSNSFYATHSFPGEDQDI